MNAELYQIDINYARVFPRDLFNEAKLLKCIGRLCLLIEDRMTPVPMAIGSYAQDGVEGFKIGLMDDGYLAIDNLQIQVNGHDRLFRTQYNSKLSYPLFLTVDYCDYQVFGEDGEWTLEFLEVVRTL